MTDALPTQWIDRLYARLGDHYGAAWADVLAAVDEDAMRADWARTLAGVDGQMIAAALAVLPSDPPCAKTFASLCRGKSAPKPAPQIAPKIQPPRTIKNGLAWAYRLQERERSGEQLTAAVQVMYRAALSGEFLRTGGTD